MTHSKRKGSGYEREMVHLFSVHGHEAKRAYASNGESLGCSKEVDVKVNLKNGTCFTIQCKRRKKLPNFLAIDNGVNAVIFREDRGQDYILMKLTDFFQDYLSK